MTLGMTTQSILDPRRCWKLWIEEGSLSKVRGIFADEGLINPNTLRPPTLSAIEKAAYRWALDNLDDARDDLEYAWNSVGKTLTEKDWRQFLSKKIRLAFFLQPRKIERYLVKHDLV